MFAARPSSKISCRSSSGSASIFLAGAAASQRHWRRCVRRLRHRKSRDAPGIGRFSPDDMNNASPAWAPIAVYRDIAELPSDAREILEAYSGDLCLTADWFELIRRHCLQGSEPRIYAVHAPEGGAIECLLFAMSAATRPGVRKLRSLSNSYTLHYAPLLRPGIADPSVALDALASFLA